ncbi:MAG: hypothetical protein HY892_11015, partial [Deltaproteobacteria bacterium]|nr:hypothetical protein [Deltaproteobacteria bacterium]
MKKSRMHLLIVISLVFACAALALPQAEGSMRRGIYVNGQVHYFSVGANANSQTVSHQAGTVDTNFLLTLGTAKTLTATSCTPDYGGVGMNGAVFDQKIFFAFTGNPGCPAPNKKTGQIATTNLYVVAWDLTTGDFAKDSTGAYLGPKNLGTTSHKDINTTISYSAYVDMASAAIVVYNNLLYVFSDSGVYTSGDGVNWTSYPALAVGGTGMQPLDAVTFYPPDADPLIMIIYGKLANYNENYGSLYAATWNGQFGTASVLNGQTIPFGQTYGPDSTSFAYALGLFAGTASPAYSVQPGDIPQDYSNFSPGSKTPTLQLFLGSIYTEPGYDTLWPSIRRFEYSYHTAGGQWTVDPGVFTPNIGSNYWNPGIKAFPWFTNECTADNNIQRQNLVIDISNASPKVNRSLNFTSDALVPQNTDIALSCESTGGTATDTSQNYQNNPTLFKYWNLVGVVMGPPPFAVNNADPMQLQALSNVNYGNSATSKVSNSQETSNSVLVSAGLTVQAGLEHKFGIQDQVDSNYKHAWESANETTTTSTVSYGFQLGTNNASLDPDDLDKIGIMGYAIFHAPTIVVQDYALYAYDYVTATKSGTALNQDIHTTQATGLNAIHAAFELANPGGPNDDYPGLLSGIGPFSNSTDFTGWNLGWEANGANSGTTHYVTLLGDGTKGETKLNTITFGSGGNGMVSFSQEIETVTTTGQTSDVDVSNQTGLDVGTELLGFKADLKAGYDGHFSNSVTNTATLGTEVAAVLGMISCFEPTCIKTLTIQPYLLQATDNQAPWVPAGYNAQLPWAMHWKIVSYTTIGGQQTGASPPADQASGAIVGGAAAGSGRVAGSGGSSYSLVGGKMAWQEDEWTLKPIPLTAQGFNPALGVTVKLNGYTWSSLNANGTWIRQGNIWTFRTGSSLPGDLVVLKLDFGAYTWDFNLSQADLSQALGASGGRVHV